MNKKAIELSVNFLVIIILSIVIVGFSSYILISVVTKAGDLSRMTQQDLDKRIESLHCSGKVCIAVNYKQMERGEFSVFGLKIFNNLQEQEFKVITTSTQEQTLYFQPIQYNVTIKGNEEKRIGIGFEIPKSAVSGIYIFNIIVKDQNEKQYGNPQQIRIKVP